MTATDVLTVALPKLIDGITIVGVITGVAKAFEWFDGMLSEKGRVALSLKLANVPEDHDIDSWAAIFPNLIDKIFGRKAFSFKFFLRSSVASFIALFLVKLIEARLTRTVLADAFNVASVSDTALFGLFCNCIPDYLSLLISRAIVRSMAKNPSAVRVSALLVADTLLTGLVAFIVVFVGIQTYIYFRWGYGPLSDYIPMNIWPEDTLLLLQLNSAKSILFYGSFFTSIWVWLYVLSIGLIRLAHKIRFVWVKIVPYLDIEKKPLVAIGRVAGLLAGTGYAALLGAVWLYNHVH